VAIHAVGAQERQHSLLELAAQLVTDCFTTNEGRQRDKTAEQTEPSGRFQASTVIPEGLGIKPECRAALQSSLGRPIRWRRHSATE
jgi:hypothetical protein